MDLLERGLEQMGIPFTGEQLRALLLYISELKLWNSRFRLTGSGDPRSIALHILDSLSLLHLAEKYHGSSLADIGSGNGMPGIPLALFLPRRKVSLIERSEKKCGFLRNITVLTGLRNTEVIRSDIARVEVRFDLCFSRALERLDDHIGHILKLVLPEGIYIACKGRREEAEAEVERLRPRIGTAGVEIIPLHVPFLDAERCCVVFSKSV